VVHTDTAEAVNRPFSIDGALGIAVFTAAFVVVDRLEVHIESRTDTVTLTMSEWPFIVALASMPPAAVAGARLLAAVGAIALEPRRRPLSKALFNLALSFADTMTGLTLFAVAAGGAAPGSGRWWLSALLATMAMMTLDMVAIWVAVRAQFGRAGTGPALGRMLAISLASAASVSCLALASVELAEYDPTTLVLLGPPMLVVLAWSRSYLRLAERRKTLEQLQGFGSRLAESGSLESGVEAAMAGAAEIVRATDSSIVLLDDDGGSRTWTLGQRSSAEAPTALDDVAAGTSEAVVTPDHVVVPLRLGTRTIGALAIEHHQSDFDHFGRTDATVLGAIANQAAVALENARLIERLRSESTERERLAHTDALTGLANRRGFTAELRSRFQAGRPFALVIIDLTRFKEVNDTFGHVAGDLVLATVAERLTGECRPVDHVARLGGDEFAVLLDQHDALAGSEFGHRARTAIEQPVPFDGVSIFVSASLGVACAPEHGSTEAALMHRADIALYSAKENHENSIAVFDAASEQATSRRHRLALDLRRALDTGDEFELVFQPKANLRAGAVTGVEALLRWHHPSLGAVPPDEFVTLAERTGLVNRLTTLVLERGIAQAGRWRRAGIEIGMSLNVSVVNLLDASLPDRLDDLLAEHGVPAGSITLEVTETALMRDPDLTHDVLTRLDGRGVRLSIDDFGTGHSSLAYLKRLPVQEVKIDRCFVADLATNHNDLVIARTVIGLAGNLSLSCVAEGVEDQHTWDLLRALGCEEAQGYHLARPLPAAELQDFLLTNVG
jgi:diguanylate cyclase (GGDEF)-like protein